MHTFSPAKMWIAGLTALQKPLAHLHTQFNRDLPWSTIDMDFMNLNQAAHGDREFGFICTRMGKPRKVVVGHWQDGEVQDRLAAWMRAAAGLRELRSLKVARLGDNMRQVAVTEGDKVEAQLRFGVEVERLRRERPGAADHRGLRRRGQSPRGPVRAALRAGPGTPQRRRSSRVVALCGPHRAGPAALSRRPAVSKPLPIPSKTCTG